MNGTTGKTVWPFARPVAEIHWKHTALKYGFSETETIQRYWKSSCIRETMVSMIIGNHVIAMTSERTGRVLIPYSNVPLLRVYLRHGYRPSGTRFAAKRGSVGVIKLIREDPQIRPNSFVLICFDTLKLKVLGAFPVVGYGGKNTFQHVEVYGVSVSSDSKHIALSLGMIHECNILQEAYENVVVVHNCSTMREVYRINVGQIIAAVAFDPRHANQFAIAGIPNRSGSQTLSTFDLSSGKLLMSRTIDELLVAEEEMHLEVSYHEDSGLLVVQALEPVGYSQEWLYNTFVYSADTLQPLARCSSGLLLTCHPQCMPLAAPQISPCGSHIAMANYCANQQAETPIKVFRLPCSLDLKKQCRAAIVRMLQKPADVHQLPLPTSLKMYISGGKGGTKQPAHSSGWNWNKGSPPNPASSTFGCPNAPITPPAVDNKDASWYTSSLGDFSCDPEHTEIRLHPRARNETYS